MIEVILQSLLSVFDPVNFGLLMFGILLGLILGAIPGLGGITGLTILLPFVYALSPNQSMLLLVGLAAVITTGDTIPAVLLGIPGTVAAQATILDGFQMTKNGEAGRALGASYSASILGGVFGAIALLAVLPVIRPLVLSMGSPELLMMALLGVSMIGALAAESPFIGLVLGLFGILISMVGQDPQTATYRWTFDNLYLLDGLPLVPAVLGLFAIPDLCELLAQGKTIATQGDPKGIFRGIIQGIKDTFKNWLLVLRCSVLGTYVGIVPGLGSDVVSWLTYGHLKQTMKDPDRLGKGDVRGVIAPESANNAKVGGALIPTIAFGVPGSLMMVILLGAFTMLGLIPGPEMVTTNLDVTATIIWALVLANVIGGILCMLLSTYIAKLCYVRVHLLVPVVMVAIFIAALQETSHIADILVLFVFGLGGWLMKKVDWPRPPLVLGLVLGPVVGQYFFISNQSYGWTWLARPGVIILAIILVGSVVLSTLKRKPQTT